MKSILPFFIFLLFTWQIGFTQDLTPAQIVQKQMDAYNQRDVEAFVAMYSADIKVYNFPDELVFEGKEKMRERYSNSFSSTPDLHSTLISRSILGNTVIDQEYIIVDNTKPAIEMIVIYKIQGQEIIEMYWLRKEEE